MPEEHIAPADAVQGGLLSHIPNEIIAKIFLAGTELWRDFEPYSIPFPVLVSATCVHWRLLSESTPQLWTDIHPPLWKNPEDCLRWTTKWLNQSGMLPVAVIVDDRAWKARDSDNVARTTQLIISVLGLVSKHVQRLHRLDIRAENIEPLETFTQQNLSNAPQLQQISLCSYSHHNVTTSFVRQHSENMKWSSLLALPSLKKLRIRRISPPFVSNLTSLTIYYLDIGYEDLKNVFKASPRLAHLVLHEPLPLGDGLLALEIMPVEIPSLRSLALGNTRFNHGIGASRNDTIFKFMIIPNLVYLELDGYVASSSIFGSSLDSSLSKIKTLRIANCPSSPLRLPDIKFYHSFSSLQHLELIKVPAKELFSANPSHPAHSTKLTVKQHSALLMLPRPNDPVSKPNSHIWPELRTITLDTLVSDDLVSLTNYVVLHQNHVQSLYLSPHAMRHLSQNVIRKADKIYPRPWGYSAGKARGDMDSGTSDVHEWLGKLVKLTVLQLPNYGLVSPERPLLQMR